MGLVKVARSKVASQSLENLGELKAGVTHESEYFKWLLHVLDKAHCGELYNRHAWMGGCRFKVKGKSFVLGKEPNDFSKSVEVINNMPEYRGAGSYWFVPLTDVNFGDLKNEGRTKVSYPNTVFGTLPEGYAGNKNFAESSRVLVSGYMKKGGCRSTKYAVLPFNVEANFGAFKYPMSMVYAINTLLDENLVGDKDPLYQELEGYKDKLWQLYSRSSIQDSVWAYRVLETSMLGLSIDLGVDTSFARKGLQYIDVSSGAMKGGRF